MVRSIIPMFGDEGVRRTRRDEVGIVGWTGIRARRGGTVAEIGEEGAGRRCKRGEELKMARSRIVIAVDIKVDW